MNSKIFSAAVPVILSMAILGGPIPAFAQGHDYRSIFVKNKRHGSGRHFGQQRHDSRRHGYHYEHHGYWNRRPYGYSYYPRHGFTPHRYYYQPDSYFPYRGDKRWRWRGC